MRNFSYGSGATAWVMAVALGFAGANIHLQDPAITTLFVIGLMCLLFAKTIDILEKMLATMESRK